MSDFPADLFMLDEKESSQKSKKLSPFRQKLSLMSSLLRLSFQWGFIPYVVYLGFRQGADPGMPFTFFNIFL
ncbi:unnamed protein product [Gordionus sp. m RMFG-2023]